MSKPKNKRFKISIPEAPEELVELRYRQAFHLSWDEFIKTPFEVYQRDLEILAIEGGIKNS